MKKLMFVLISLGLLGVIIHAARVETEEITFEQGIDLNGQPITNVGDPSSAQDVATKTYVDTAVVVTGQVSIIYSDGQSTMFPNQPSVPQLTNAVTSTFHKYAAFDKDTWQLLGGNVVYLPSNFDSNITVKADIHTAGTTNLTCAMLFWYSDGASSYTLTNEITLTSASISAPQSWSFSTNLANAVAGDKIYWSVGMADTNSSSTTRDASVYLEVTQCEFFAQ